MTAKEDTSSGDFESSAKGAADHSHEPREEASQPQDPGESAPARQAAGEPPGQIVLVADQVGAASGDELRAALAANAVAVIRTAGTDPDETSRADADALGPATGAIICVDDQGLPPPEALAPVLAAAEADIRFGVVIARLPGASDDDLPLPSSLAASPEVDLTEVEELTNPEVGKRIVEALRHSGRPQFSFTVATAIDRLGLGSTVTASQVAAAIIAVRRERPGDPRPYAGGIEPGQLRANSRTRRTVTSWLREVDGHLGRPARRKLSGRRVLVALAALDKTCRNQLAKDGYLDAIRAEVDPGGEDSVPTYTDNPAVKDALGRQSFAKVLARRIRWMRIQDSGDAAAWSRRDRGGAFLLHVYGPWGIGKTSLLRFLREELYLEDRTLALVPRGKWAAGPWAVIEFNAWEHQRMAPPWWWLMTTVYRQGVKELRRAKRWRRAATLVAKEWVWRLHGGWPGILAALAIFVGAMFLNHMGAFSGLSLGNANAFVLAVAAILTPIVAIWGVLYGVSRWVFATSARGARTFIDHTKDPMGTVKGHMWDLVGWIGLPTLIYIDDLDRCKASYVVELLEGIQTLFREVPVAYVVAADRDWLTHSFAHEYSDFTNVIDEPGRSLGEFFLEKTFQLTAPVPALDTGVTESFWSDLLLGAPARSSTSLEEFREDAQTTFASMTSQEEIARRLELQPFDNPAERQVLFEQAAVHLSAPALEREAKHVLRAFHPLVEANPRAMKRLINTYGMLRSTRTVTGRIDGSRLAQQQAALWVILSMRWPQLARYLQKHPKHVEYLYRPDASGNLKKPIEDGLEKELEQLKLLVLFRDERVTAVVEGEAKDVDARLDEDAIRSLTMT